MQLARIGAKCTTSLLADGALNRRGTGARPQAVK